MENTIEIKTDGDYFHVRHNGQYLRCCNSYDELANCIGNLIKLLFKKDLKMWEQHDRKNKGN